MTPDPLSADDRPSPAEAAPRRQYQKTQAQYVQMYRVSVPTVKRWRRRGLPLDDPDALAEYFSPRGRKPANHREEGLDNAEAEARLRDMPADEMEKRGLPAAIAKLQSFEVVTARAVRQAIAGGHARRIAEALAHHGTVLAQLRRCEKESPAHVAKDALSASLSKLEARIQAGCQALAELPARTADQLEGLDHTGRAAVLQREVEAIKRLLEPGESSHPSTSAVG